MQYVWYLLLSPPIYQGPHLALLKGVPQMIQEVQIYETQARK